MQIADVAALPLCALVLQTLDELILGLPLTPAMARDEAVGQMLLRPRDIINDVSWAQQHLADGFIAGHSWGQWQTKDEFIKGLQDKSAKWKSGNVSDLHVATFGSNTAVAHYKFAYDAEIGGTHRARTVICSDTWVNDSGTWKSASTHCSLV